MRERIETALKFGLYPVLLGAVAATTYLAIARGWDLQRTYGIATVALVALLVAVERAFPLSPAWSMTLPTFVRDLKYIAVVGPTIATVRLAFGVLAIHLGGRGHGPLAGAPFAVGLVAALFVFELLQYGFHRLSHEAKGRTGRFLWAIHLAHHLPDRVYVLMHAVFHPLNALVTTAIIQLTLVGLGASPAVAFAAMMLIDLQSLVSHFNFDLRLGPLGYVFIGPETHRVHHSADVAEAGNYGNTLAIWDLVFGTFRYRPGAPPRALGVAAPEAYPTSEQVLGVLAFPISGRGR